MIVRTAIALMVTGVFGTAGAQGTADKIDRTVLPIQTPKRPVYKGLDVRNVKAPPHFEVTAPSGAPNVVIILIDDLGFGAASAFGCTIRTPTLDGLAQKPGHDSQGTSGR